MTRVGLLLALALVACSPAPDRPSESEPAIDGKTAALRANTNFALHLGSLADAILFLQDSAWVEEALGSGGGAVECPEPPPGMPPEPCAVEEGPTVEDLDVRDGVSELEDWLAEHVFNEANVESTDATSATFRLRPESVCPMTWSESAQTDVRDPDCVQVLTKVVVRLRATASGSDGVHFAVSVQDTTANKTWQPGGFALTGGGATLEVQLPEVAGALQALAAASGEEIEGIPAVLAGGLRLALVRDRADAYRAELTALGAVRVADGATTDRDYFDVRIADGSRLGLGVDAAAKTVSATVAVGAVDVDVALDAVAGSSGECPPSDPDDPNPQPCTPPAPLSGVISAHLAGAGASTTFTAGSDTVAITGIGLGGGVSTVKYNGTTLFSLDATSLFAGTPSVTLARTDAGASLTLGSAFALSFLHDLRSLQSQFDDIAAWALQGTEQIRFDGAANPSLVVLENEVTCEEPLGGGEPVCTPSGPERFLKVVAGTLTLSASALAQPVAVAANQCLVEAAAEGDVHPFAMIAAGVCE